MSPAFGAPPSPRRLRLAEDAHPPAALDAGRVARLRGFLLARGRMVEGLDPTEMGRDWCIVAGPKEQVFADGQAELSLGDPGIDALLTESARGVPLLYGYPLFIDEKGNLSPLFTAPALLKPAGYRTASLSLEIGASPALEPQTLVNAGNDAGVARAVSSNLARQTEGLGFTARLRRAAAALDLTLDQVGGRDGPTEPWDAWPGPRWSHVPILFHGPKSDQVPLDLPPLLEALAIAQEPTALDRVLAPERPWPKPNTGPPEVALPVYHLPICDAGGIDRLASPALGVLAAPPGSARLPAVIGLAAADLVAGRRTLIVTADQAQADRYEAALQRVVAPGGNWVLTGRPKRLLALMDGLAAKAGRQGGDGVQAAQAVEEARKAFRDAQSAIRAAQKFVGDMLADAGPKGLASALTQLVEEGNPTGPLRARVEEASEGLGAAARAHLTALWGQRRAKADATACRQSLGRLADFAAMTPSERRFKPKMREAVAAWRDLADAAPIAVLTLEEVEKLLPMFPDMADRIVIDGADRMAPAVLAPLLVRAQQATLTTRHPTWTLPVTGAHSETLALVSDRQPDALVALSDGSFNGALRLLRATSEGPQIGTLRWIDRPLDMGNSGRDPVVPTLLAQCHEAVEAGLLDEKQGSTQMGSVVVTAIDPQSLKQLEEALAPFRDRDERYRRILVVSPDALVDRRADMVLLAAPVRSDHGMEAASLRTGLPDLMVDALGAARLTVVVVGDRTAALEVGGPLARLALQADNSVATLLPGAVLGRLQGLTSIADLALVGQPGGIRLFTPLGAAYDFALPDCEAPPEWPRIPVEWLEDGDWHLPALFARLV